MHYLSAIEASPSNSPAVSSQFSASVLYFSRKAPASILNFFYTHQDRQLVQILTIDIYTRAIRSLTKAKLLLSQIKLPLYSSDGAQLGRGLAPLYSLSLTKNGFQALGTGRVVIFSCL